ncbi:MAG: ankyrin repeat domain-containing protein [Steroidobacteraceae bacterium]
MVFKVEPLPPRPSLEHQHKLAKRLLREVWAEDPAAMQRVRACLRPGTDLNALKLQQAQLVIARGYGFDSWAAMKHKIESLTQSPLEQFDSAVRESDAPRARELLVRHAAIRSRINEPRFDFDSPAIHQAKQNLELVDVLLEYGADINARSAFWAGGFGILESNLTAEQARPLIERGALITIWAAAALGFLDELRTLIRARPECVREGGGDGKTALHCAATPEIAELLVRSGADLEARDTDHAATPLQYLIADEDMARLLIAAGARADIFAAARLGDAELIRKCLRADPASAEVRVNVPPYSAPGLHIYSWTLGFDLTPIDVARKFGHDDIVELLLAQVSPSFRLIDALWCGDGARLRRELALRPQALSELDPGVHTLLAAAAWWYRPESVRLMLEAGFDPHVTGAHRSTPLDRASFHGYADIVATLLAGDQSPPLAVQNEFGGTPLGACIFGSLNGWKTGHPQDHARTVQLLLEAGSALEPAWLPTGNDELDGVMRNWLKS